MSKTNEKLERRALSVEEAARTCGLSRATIYRLINEKKLTTLKIGARRVVPIGAIDALLKEGARVVSPSTRKPAPLVAGRAPAAFHLAAECAEHGRPPFGNGDR